MMPTTEIERYAEQLRRDAETADDGVAVGLLRAADGLGDLLAAQQPQQSGLADLRERFAALAAVEEYIGESCGNAAHNIRNVLAGDDPRREAVEWGLEFRNAAAKP
ncbi:hypothetical protein [Micromonospora sp. RV43]|uniref:hypothetical protein n=1 Tax=Micromonospora sp. RV43 TaxID=1661387 RepID=UPI00064C3333|nr:hypothetical protein [Micromonospora sp. RV43]